MSRRGWTRARAVAGICAAAAVTATAGGCGRNVDLPASQLGQSTHFEYWARASDTKVCPDVLATLEANFSTLQGYLGFDWPRGARVQYYKFLDAQDFSAHAGCPKDAGGCARQTNVLTTNAMDTHELVHAYLYPTGAPPLVLVEGAAVALSCTARGYDKPTLGWEELATVPPFSVDPVTVYSAGAWLVAYLLDELGPQRFISLYGSIGAGATSAELDAAVRRVYGQSLAALWTAALAEAQPRSTCIWECSGAPLPLDGSVVDTAGACGPDIARTFSLPTDGTISFSLDGPVVGLGSCGRGVVPGAGINGALAGGTLAIYRLTAGSYFLSHNPNAGTIVGTADASAVLSPSCGAAVDVAQLDRANIFVALPSMSGPWFLPVPSRNGHDLIVQRTPDTAGATLCASCGAAACADASRVSAWAPGQVLQLAPDPTRDFSEYILSWP
jgi:hypothetical protein